MPLFQKLQDYLIDEYAAGRRVVLIFDEAQNLSVEVLEQLRLLTNQQLNTVLKQQKLVVTATRRKQYLEDAPTSVEVVNDQAIRARSASDLDEILENAQLIVDTRNGFRQDSPKIYKS